MDATIWWFKQPVFFFQTNNTVVRIDVEGKELRSYAQTKRDLEADKKSELRKSFVMLIFFILVYYVYKRTATTVLNAEQKGS